MPHRVKNKHRARHRSHTFKAASLSRPALPLPAEETAEAKPTETTAPAASTETEEAATATAE